MAIDTLERWGPELRRAMMRVCPKFFSWSPQDRDRFRLNLPVRDKRRLDQALMKELFGAKMRSWTSDKHGNKRIPLRELNRWNGVVRPDREQALLLQRLGLTLPERLRPPPLAQM